MIEDKIERMLHAMEHPEEYSDEELQQLMDDEEVRDCYELALAARQGFRMKDMKERKRPIRAFYKVVAMFVGVLLLSGIAFAAVHVVRSSRQKAQPAETVVTDTLRSQPVTQTAKPDSTTQRTVVFENVELEQILVTLADHYQVGVEYRNEDARHLRLYTKWETTAPLSQMLERLNKFEKVKITLSNQQMVVE